MNSLQGRNARLRDLPPATNEVLDPQELTSDSAAYPPRVVSTSTVRSKVESLIVSVPGLPSKQVVSTQMISSSCVKKSCWVWGSSCTANTKSDLRILTIPTRTYFAKCGNAMSYILFRIPSQRHGHRLHEVIFKGILCSSARKGCGNGNQPQSSGCLRTFPASESLSLLASLTSSVLARNLPMSSKLRFQ